MRRAYLLITIIFFSVCLSAQQAGQYVFTHLSSFNGLSSNIVNNVTQDRKGYMWIATLDGLQRYDGYRFMTFRNRISDPKTVPADIINRVLEDTLGNIWVWGGQRVGIFNTTTFTFTDVKLQNALPDELTSPRFVELDDEGNVIVYIEKKGLFTYDAAKKLFVLTGPNAIVPPDMGYVSQHRLPNTPYLFYSGTNYIAVYDFRTGNLNYRGHNPDKNPLVEKIKDIKHALDVYVLNKDFMWYSTWDFGEKGAPHVKSINLKTGEITLYNEAGATGYHEYVGGMVQRNGRLWFYGKAFILEGTNNKDNPFTLVKNEYKDEQSIKFDWARNMYEDRQNNIWISTDNGIFIFNPDAQTFNNYNLIRPDGTGPVDGPTITTLQLKDGRILAGSWGTGLYMYDNNFKPIQMPPGLDKIRLAYAIWSSLQQKESGLVWLGLQGGSVIVYDPVTHKTEMFNPELIYGSTIRQVTEDHQGNIWFGMQGGHIVKWDKKLSGGDVKKGYVTVRSRGMGAFINKLFTDKNGYVWAASEGRGVFKYDPVTNKQLLVFTEESGPGKSLYHNITNDILQYDDTTLLVAGGAINVINLRTDQVTYLTSEDGLPSNTVYCMVQDKRGMIWMGLAHGLSQFNYEKRIATFYDRRDGLRFDNFVQAGAFKMNDGRLVFVTEHSFTSFDPEKILKTPRPPAPVITEFKLGKKSLPLDSVLKTNTVTLQHDNTAISVEFSTLTYLQQNKIHYFYMLEGIDKTWQEANGINQAVYSHLPSGKFTFKLRTENADGIGGEAITSFVIKVQPPFWKTWWFLGLIIFAVIGLFFWLDKQRMQKIRATESVRSRIAGSLTEDLSNSLSSINISSELAKTKVDKDPQRTKEYINQISEASNRMIQSMYDMVWSINPRNDTMQHTIDRMKSYAAEIEAIFNLDIVFDIDKDVTKLNLDMEYRYELLSIFKEALDNAGRHAQARHIHVNIQFQRPKLIMLMEDDGKGFDADLAALKRGISDMRRRAAAVNASFYIESSVNTGTIVKVVMPVG